MSEAAGLPWSSEQLSWLQALGHVVYLDRDAVVEAPARAIEAAVPPAAAAPAERAAPPRRQAPVAPDTQAPVIAPELASSGPRRGRSGLPDRLQIALLRACGLNPNDPSTQTLMATWPLAELRANPRAKRALWPQLRALRRQGRARS
ncbi:alanine acetyltransferase [Stenotrophomonas sp. HITSZ_GD]|uniref:alanine acetyltransferase n=1 Tax=Stenotrophomonas sp. HITSZ_GD TaxID=3037248 RepID=UPI00240D7B25|nr:alanine acetyltransferase [Stenotrophomonas sp. HITSZ_GD]MDG2525664.1 alanine acetyltransferase [Stenotrophomonas sp. HITSZ_GD]